MGSPSAGRAVLSGTGTASEAAPRRLVGEPWGGRVVEWCLAPAPAAMWAVLVVPAVPVVPVVPVVLVVLVVLVVPVVARRRLRAHSGTRSRREPPNELRGRRCQDRTSKGHGACESSRDLAWPGPTANSSVRSPTAGMSGVGMCGPDMVNAVAVNGIGSLRGRGCSGLTSDVLGA